MKVFASMSLVSFHNELSFTSLNLIHVGFQKSSIGFCFIYLTNSWPHIICVFKTSIQPNVIHFMWSIISHREILLHNVMKSFRFCPCGHFYPCLKFHLCRQFYPNTWILRIPISHTGVSSHIIQYAHSGNQALALEHIVRYHQAFLRPPSVSGYRKISTTLISNDREKNITYWTLNSLGRRNLWQECWLQDGTLVLLTCGMIIWKENTNELHLHNTIFANLLIRESRWWALQAKFHCSQEDTATTAGFVMSRQIMRLHKVANCQLWEVNSSPVPGSNSSAWTYN
jgi:hypothetical protein